MSVFVYAIVPAALEPPALVGLGTPPADVRIVGVGDVAALVSDLPGDEPPGTRADLEAHATVLATLVEHEATVVPMRFGMVFDDDEAVRHALLERHREQLTPLIRTLEGRVQITLKAVYDDDVLLRDVAAVDSRIARLSELTRRQPDTPEAQRYMVELGELTMQGVERLRAEDERAVIERIATVADEVLVDEPRHERIAVTAQLLVRRDRIADLDAAVDELVHGDRGRRMTFRLIGPLAPWSFADMSLDQAEGAWA